MLKKFGEIPFNYLSPIINVLLLTSSSKFKLYEPETKLFVEEKLLT